MNLNALGAIIGALPDTVHLPEFYFLQRGCFIDARGPLEIAEDTTWGFCVKVLTQSHNLIDGEIGEVIERPVVVKSGAWVCSYALLYNCIIGKNAIVGAGAVVKSCEVAPGVRVEGNPARVVARLVDGRWKYCGKRWRMLE